MSQTEFRIKVMSDFFCSKFIFWKYYHTLPVQDEDGKINFEEFCNIVGNTDVHKKMVVDV